MFYTARNCTLSRRQLEQSCEMPSSAGAGRGAWKSGRGCGGRGRAAAVWWLMWLPWPGVAGQDGCGLPVTPTDIAT